MAKRKTLFDDRPVEIAELTFIIKQDLSSLNSQISQLQSLSKSQHSQITRNAGGDQVGEHNKIVWFPKSKRIRKVMWEQVVVLLQGKLADVGVNFEEVLEVRTKNIQAITLPDRELRFLRLISHSAKP